MSTTTATATAADDDGDDGFFSSPPSNRYALSGKIMLGAITALVIVGILMIFLHLYVRLYLLSPMRRRRRRRHPPPEPPVAVAAAQPSSRGLSPSILKSLPVFVHSAKPDPDPDPVYCAVCLSEFEENEIGRVIPKCNHGFHVGCIDMWFYSHVTCPLCRSEVGSEPEPGSGDGSFSNPIEIVVEEEPGRGDPVEVDDESRDVNDVSEDGSSRVTVNLVKPLTIKMILCDVTERDLEKEVTEAVGSEG